MRLSLEAVMVEKATNFDSRIGGASRVSWNGGVFMVTDARWRHERL